MRKDHLFAEKNPRKFANGNWEEGRNPSDRSEFQGAQG